jgi:Periplasmic binding protein
MRLNRRFVNLGLAASLAAPALLRRARAETDTIKIGMVLSVTGPGADSGKYALTGATIALDRINKAGGVNGKSPGCRSESRKRRQLQRSSLAHGDLLQMQLESGPKEGAFAKGRAREVQPVRIDHHGEEEACWLHGEG